MIQRITNPGFTHGYCQFSGGGDIYINSKLPSQYMVICDGNEETEDQDFTGVSTFIIEGKKIDEVNKQLIYQLYANTILACAETFVEHLPEYDKPIKEIQQISGYGIAITGLGNVGVYVLLIQFGKPMKFITKLPLAQRPQPTAASIVD